MKVLVTSGGTKIPIDMVRDITNMSSGTFGSKIAKELLKMGHDVYFLHAKGSKTPMKLSVDLTTDINIHQVNLWMKEMTLYRNQYHQFYYRTFEDYKEVLERMVKFERPDVVILTAAVSDYGVANPVKGKIRSKDDLTISLAQLPKVISYIKSWHPKVKLVGFKLLVNSKDYQLIEASQNSIKTNGCDMIVANDLSDIKDNNHRVHLVFPNTSTITYKTDVNDPNYLARMVAEHSTKL